MVVFIESLKTPKNQFLTLLIHTDQPMEEGITLMVFLSASSIYSSSPTDVSRTPHLSQWWYESSRELYDLCRLYNNFVVRIVNDIVIIFPTSPMMIWITSTYFISMIGTWDLLLFIQLFGMRRHSSINPPKSRNNARCLVSALWNSLRQLGILSMPWRFITFMM